MSSDLRFTKENTLALKGIAIIFLLCYHSFYCFSLSNRYEEFGVVFVLLSESVALYISRGMQVCVGIFLFLSVYGLTLSMKRMYKDYELSRHDSIVYVIQRYMKLLSMFLTPFLLCQIVTKVMGFSRYGENKVEQIGNFILDMLGVGNIFGSTLLVQTWWYLSLTVMVVIFMPFSVTMYKKYGWTLVLMVLVLGSLLVKEFERLTSWLLLIPIAICFADQKVLERIRGFKVVNNWFLNKLLKFIIMTVMLWVLFRLRLTDWGYHNLRFALNAAVPMMVICWSYEFIIELPAIKQILQFLGQHSANIFYVHSFIRGIWLQEFLYSFKYAVLILLVLLIVSLCASFLCEGIKKLLHYNKLTDVITTKVVGWADRTL